MANGNYSRNDLPAVPPLALREALVNAFAHRDYSLGKGAVSIAIYDDRLEVWSDGVLPSQITVEQLHQQHSSHARNELIANVLYRRDMIEEWGRGTLKMLQQCENANLPSPQFSEDSGSFCVSFRFSTSIRGGES